MVRWNRFIRNVAGAIAMAVALSGAFANSSMVAYADEEGTVHNAAVLNVRSGPGTEYERITTLNNGAKVSIISEENGWCKISINGTTGYVASQYIQKAGQSGNNLSAGSSAVVNTEVLFVRKGPGKDTASLGFIYKNAAVQILGVEGDWYKVSTKVNGVDKEGYVYAQYIKAGTSDSASAGSSSNNNTASTEKPAIIKTGKTTDPLNVRDGANTKGTSVLGVLPKGGAVNIVEVSGDWYKVIATFNGREVTGYVSAAYVTGVGDAGTNTNTSAGNGTAVTGKGKVVDGPVNFRSQASTASQRYGVLANGTTFDVLEKLNGWYKVKLSYNGKETTGYIYDGCVKLTDGGNTNTDPADNGNQNNNENQNNNGSQNNNENPQNVKGTVKNGPLNVRNGGSMTAGVIGTVKAGTALTIIKTEGDWYNVKVTVSGREVTGYVYRAHVNATGESAGNNAAGSNGFTDVNERVWATEGVNIRKGPSTDDTVLSGLAKNASITRTGVSDEWSRVKYGNATAYIYSKYLTTENPNGGSASGTTTSGVTGEDIVAFAMQFEGNPYVWGGNDLNTGVDCSGFTQQVYKHFGIMIERVADSQRKNGTPVASLEEAKPGDLIFYGSGGYAGHVAIYIGNGKVIHASSPSVGIIISNATYKTPMQINRIID